MMNDSTRTAATDSEPGRPTATTTGEPRVDEALARLAGLGRLPDAGHIEAFEHVYQRLRGLLGELDTAESHPSYHGASDSYHGASDTSDGQAEQA